MSTPPRTSSGCPMRPADRPGRSRTTASNAASSAPGTPGVRSLRTTTASSSLTYGDDHLSQQSLERILQDLTVEPEIRGLLLELAVRLLELLESADFFHAHPRELLLPPLERLLADSHLPADLSHRRSALGLPLRERDLLRCIPQLFHRPALCTEAGLSQKNPAF